MENRHLADINKHLKFGHIASARAELLSTFKTALENYCKEKHFNEKEELHLAHYTSLRTIYSILKNSRKASHKVNQNETGCLRLYDAFSLNDPNEGKYLKDLKEKLIPDYDWLRKAEDETDAFVCSFVSGDKFVGNNLMYWQSYGNDGLGCSIQLPPDFKNGMLKCVVYENDEANELQEKFKPYFDMGTQLVEKLPSEAKESFATEFWKVFDKIKFLYKSDTYRHEKEYRYVVVPGNDKEVLYDFKDGGPYLRRYIEVPEFEANKILISGSKVVIGPRVPDSDRVSRDLEKLARQSELRGPEFSHSKISYRKVW